MPTMVFYAMFLYFEAFKCFIHHFEKKKKKKTETLLEIKNCKASGSKLRSELHHFSFIFTEHELSFV